MAVAVPAKPAEIVAAIDELLEKPDKFESTFKLFDADGNGSLDEEELQIVGEFMLAMVGLPRSTLDAKAFDKFFQKYDENANGLLEVDEFVPMFREYLTHVKAACEASSSGSHSSTSSSEDSSDSEPWKTRRFAKRVRRSAADSARERPLKYYTNLAGAAAVFMGKTLEDVPVTDLPIVFPVPSNPRQAMIFQISSKKSLGKALQVLSKHDIMSVPVQRNSDGKYIGYLEAMDIIKHVIGKGNKPVGKDAEKLLEKTTCEDIVDPSTWKPLKEKNNPSILLALEILGHDVPRVALLGNKGQILRIITQSLVVDFLDNFPEYLAGSVDSTLEEAGLIQGEGRVFTMPTDKSVAEVFRKAAKAGVTGVALTHKKKLAAVFCLHRDLKYVEPGNLSELNDNVLEFLKKKRPSHKPFDWKRAAYPTSTVREVLRILFDSHEHRVFVVDPDSKHVVGVVSLSDVLTFAIAKNASSGTSSGSGSSGSGTSSGSSSTNTSTSASGSS